jgi:hypothetical protein
MANIANNFNVHQPFSPAIGEYRVEFTEEEEKTIKKWTDPDYYMENSLVADCGDGSYIAKPYSTPEERRHHVIWQDDFLILYVGMNLLKQPEWESLGQTIRELGTHYTEQIAGMTVPEGAYIDACDSWIIRNHCTTNYPQPYHRRHCHSFAWLTGVLYLDDSPNGTVLHAKQPFSDSYEPFCWQLNNNQYNEDEIFVPAEKGKCIIFPSRIDHSIMNNADLSTRHVVAFNLWPYGNISNSNAARMSYEYVPTRGINSVSQPYPERNNS